MNAPNCGNCGAYTVPVFNPETRRLKAWMCEECEISDYHHWFVPPTGTNWERDLTPEQWAACQNVVDIGYRERKRGNGSLREQ